MKILTLDTSSIVASVAIGDEEKLIAEYTINHKKTHSQKLLPMIEEVLERCELKTKDIDLFGVSLGPGSFTGLRIGITTVKVMAQALNKPVVGVSSLEGLAYNIPFFDGLICPIIDAQRESVYSAIYSWEGDKLNTVKQGDVFEVKDLLKHVKDLNKKTIFLGDGLNRFKDQIQEELPSISIFPNSSVVLPRASSILEIVKSKSKQGLVSEAKDILPIYMRKSQAERQYEARMIGCEL